MSNESTIAVKITGVTGGATDMQVTSVRMPDWRSVTDNRSCESWIGNGNHSRLLPSAGLVNGPWPGPRHTLILLGQHVPHRRLEIACIRRLSMWRRQLRLIRSRFFLRDNRECHGIKRLELVLRCAERCCCRKNHAVLANCDSIWAPHHVPTRLTCAQPAD